MGNFPSKKYVWSENVHTIISQYSETRIYVQNIDCNKMKLTGEFDGKIVLHQN